MASIPDPTPGLVISYVYLWRQEAAKGRDEGSKKRPCVVVLAARPDEGGGKMTLVAPITHSPPDDPSASPIERRTAGRAGPGDDVSYGRIRLMVTPAGSMSTERNQLGDGAVVSGDDEAFPGRRALRRSPGGLKLRIHGSWHALTPERAAAIALLEPLPRPG